MVSDLRVEGVTLDHLVVQVGGGALASACIQAFEEAVGLGALDRRPADPHRADHGGHPLERAYERVRAGLQALAGAVRHPPWRCTTPPGTGRRSCGPGRSEPRSIATGILDDETYDWRAVVERHARHRRAGRWS